MPKIIVTLSGSWVLSRRNDDMLPVDFVVKKLKEHFGTDVTIEDEGLTQFVVVVSGGMNSADKVVEKIKTVFSEEYTSDVANEVLSIKAMSDGEAFLGKLKEQKEQSKGDQSSESESQEESIDTIEVVEETSKTAKCLEAIDALVGADEFKELAREIVDIAPQIVANQTFDVLACQSYIFSVNDGYGLSTYLSSFAALLSSLNIKNLASVEDVIEETLLPPNGESDSSFQPVLEHFKFPSRRKNVRILCIDISEWMSKTNERSFKKFLTEVARHMDEYVVVFRVPFVDKEVLNQLRISLNDLMFVRTVSFPPFDQDELQACAAAELKNYGFTMADDAWEGFHRRIAEEKRDGKFYGINTIKKVIKELLYKKQLSNARNSKTDTHITFEDVTEICVRLRESALSGYEMLDRMIGGDVFRARIDEIISQIEFARSRGDVKMPCIHMRFVGNPGTGKTTVARIVGKILKEKGILRVGNFFERVGRDFCGRYIGETAPKTAGICRDAYGSVLFIDEAYSLYRGDGNDRDYGREALDTLIAEMENHRSDLVVIMAGYTDEMNTLMEGNAGLASRMPYVIEFPNFTREQLYDIFVSMMNGNFEFDEEMLPAVKDYFMSIPDHVINSKEFSNARFVRNLFERTWAKASMRCQLEKISKIVLTKDDFDRSISDKEFCFLVEKKSKIGFVN